MSDNWRDFEAMEETEEGKFIMTRTDSMILRCIAAANDTTPYRVLGTLLENFVNNCGRTLQNDIFRK